MEKIGIVREVDAFGRMAIPIELKRNMNIEPQTPMEMFVEDEDKIILKKHASGCVFCGKTEGLVEYMDKYICKDCLEEL